ncbi:MAG: Uma2 family endonuclease, partial [Planctomycetia bacterium]|nr:Uma2 family endonuclease [Planctomycetia bacterium]
MNVVAARPKLTPEDLLHMKDGDRYELVDGQLLEKFTNGWSSLIAGLLMHRLLSHSLARRLGLAGMAGQTFRCFPASPGRVRKPDVAVLRLHLLTYEQLHASHCPIAPELVVEVLCPDDLALVCDEQIDDYQRAGVRLIWIVNPELRTVRIHRIDGTITGLHEQDVLSGEDVIVGFQVRV